MASIRQLINKGEFTMNQFIIGFMCGFFILVLTFCITEYFDRDFSACKQHSIDWSTAGYDQKTGDFIWYPTPTTEQP